MAAEKAGSDDEVDLVALMFKLWEGKWVIAGLAGLGIALGGVFGLGQPFIATIDLRPVTSDHILAYRGLNQTRLFSIDREELYSHFVETLETRAAFVVAFDSVEKVDRAQYDSTDEYEAALFRKAFTSIEVVQRSRARNASNQDAPPSWSVRLEETDRDRAREIIRRALDEAVLSTRAHFLESFGIVVDGKVREQENKIEDLNLRIAHMFADYETRNARRLAFLEEQRAIARQLGIARNPLFDQSTTDAGANVNILSSDFPFFLWGYEAIEKEIDLIGERSEARPFVVGLAEAEQELRALQADLSIPRVQAAFAETPLGTGVNFRAAQFDLNAIDISGRSRLMLLALGAVLGGLLGMGMVLVRSAVLNYQKRHAAVQEKDKVDRRADDRVFRTA